MDKKLRNLERRAHQTGSADDMYRFYCEYRRLNPRQEIKLSTEKQSEPRFWDVDLPILGYPGLPDLSTPQSPAWQPLHSVPRLQINIEVSPTRNNFVGVDIEVPINGVPYVMDWLLGTTQIAMSQGPPTDLLDFVASVSSSPYHTNKSLGFHLYLSWDDDYQLQFHRSNWHQNNGPECVGFVFVSKQHEEPSPVFVTANEPALAKNFMPWIDDWWKARYQDILEWQKGHIQHYLNSLENQLEEQKQRIQSIQAAMDETKTKLAQNALYQMKLAEGRF